MWPKSATTTEEKIRTGKLSGLTPPEVKERPGTREGNEKRPGKVQGVNQKSIGIILSLNIDLAKEIFKIRILR